ncbi:MAG TPA: glycosyltransferase family 2 protein [Puia sp.]|nr:glycosyltransferase family 2 protein [Puia sp.]
MTSQPLVSVLMTSYNREKYIADAIESVLASSYTNFELIIVDDTSRDGTVEIARKYERLDSRIRVYVNETNLGDYPNRNRAASYATGKYLKYLDSDDLIYPHGLEVMVRAMEKFPDAGMGTPYHREQDTKPYPYLVDPESAYKEYFLKEDFLQTGPSGVIMRRSSFEQAGGFSGKRFIGDFEMWLTLAAREPVVKFQSALFWWRQHEGQEYKHGQTMEGYYTLIYVTMRNLLMSPGCPLNEQDRNFILSKLKRRQSRFVLGLMVKKLKFSEAKFVMEKCALPLGDILKYSFS